MIERIASKIILSQQPINTLNLNQTLGYNKTLAELHFK
jgi:hypothetical protein